MYRLQTRQLALVGRHDDLPARFPADPVIVAELLHQPGALDAQSGLERSRLVIRAGVDDAAVVTGLMGAETRLLVEDDEAEAWNRFGQGERRGQPDDPTTDQRDISRLGHAAGYHDHARQRFRRQPSIGLA